ncbi:MAG: alpha/beta hydrolase [Caulobacter sp.]|nr:alpha/beta hydrolase [Caulobacter sp.]
MNLVLVSGFMADGDLWRDVADDLAAIGPVFLKDLSRGDTIEAMAERILDAAPPRFALIGFSMGGYVARAMVRQAPDRVAALILIATSARGDSAVQAARQAAAVDGVAPQRFRGLSRAAITASLSPTHAQDEAMVDRVRAMGLRLGWEVFVRQSRVTRADELGRLAELRVPTLVIAATEDRLRSLEEARELVAGIPDATLRVIADSGHMIPIEQPAALAREIRDWLGRVAV